MLSRKRIPNYLCKNGNKSESNKIFKVQILFGKKAKERKRNIFRRELRRHRVIHFLYFYYNV